MQEYQSQDITKLAKALLSVQKTLQPATKDAVNPFAKNKYASQEKLTVTKEADKPIRGESSTSTHFAWRCL